MAQNSRTAGADKAEISVAWPQLTQGNLKILERARQIRVGDGIFGAKDQ